MRLGDLTWAMGLAFASMQSCGTENGAAPTGQDSYEGGVVGESGSPSDSPQEKPSPDGPSETSSCQGFEDAKNAPTLAVKLVNQRSSAIYVGEQAYPCSGTTEFFSLLEGSTPLKLWYPWSCQSTCECPQCGMCDGGCSPPKLWRVDPGATFEVTWTQLIVVEQSFPAECAPLPKSCLRVAPLEAGLYEIRAEAGTDCPGCTCGSNGECWLNPEQDGGIGGQELSVNATVSLPGVPAVELAFQ